MCVFRTLEAACPAAPTHVLVGSAPEVAAVAPAVAEAPPRAKSSPQLTLPPPQPASPPPAAVQRMASLPPGSRLSLAPPPAQPQSLTLDAESHLLGAISSLVSSEMQQMRQIYSVCARRLAALHAVPSRHMILTSILVAAGRSRAEERASDRDGAGRTRIRTKEMRTESRSIRPTLMVTYRRGSRREPRICRNL